MSNIALNMTAHDIISPTITKRDVLTFGEAMLRFTPCGHQRLEQAATMDIWVAGSESNVAAALCVLGLSSTWVGRLPDNPMGHKISGHLQSRGVDISAIVWTAPNERVGTFYLEAGAAPRATRVVYDRAHSAASRLSPADLPDTLFDSHRHLHVSGITSGLSSPCALAVADAIERARARGLTVSLDINYRALLWSPDEAKQALAPLLPQVNVLFCTRDDASRLFGLSGDAPSVAAAFRDKFGVPTVVLTTGADGAVGQDANGVADAPALPVPVTVDRIGSGDAFAAGFLAGYLGGMSLEQGLHMGVAAAALKRTIAGDILVATRAEFDAVLAQDSKAAWR